jgi:hypothetical protein
MSEQLDRFARGKLSPAESRELARQSLDNHDLFDELTSAAIARRGPAGRANRQITGPRVALLATAAAIIAGAVLYAPRPGAAPAMRTARFFAERTPTAASPAPQGRYARWPAAQPRSILGRWMGWRRARTWMSGATLR